MTKHDYILTHEQEQDAIMNAVEAKIRKAVMAAGPQKVNTDPEFWMKRITEDEREALLAKANRLEHTRRWVAETERKNRLAETEGKERLVKEWTYGRVYRLLQDGADDEGKELIYNDNTAPIIKAMCYLVSGDQRYETELGLSFSKGLILRGPTGLGKSFITRLASRNPVRPIQIINMHEVARSVIETGDFTGMRWSDHHFIYLDDLGAEYDASPIIKFMGSEINWFRSWFETFYERNQQHINRLILSTNNSFSMIEEKYGFRVRSRMAESFCVLDLHGDDMRRKKD